MANENKTKPPSLLVTKGVNTFGSLLFKDLEKANNLVFSPFCISTVLAMLTPGAKGKTLEQVKIPFQIRNHPLKKKIGSLKDALACSVLNYHTEYN